MIGFKQTGMAAAIAALFALGMPGATPADAMPAAAQAAKPAVASGELLHEVRNRDWRRRHWSRNQGRYYRDWDINPGAFIALGIVGALVEQGMSQDRASSALDQCASTYRSFEYDTGLYTTYGGDKRLCPYLR